jgi:hypothetical protein
MTFRCPASTDPDGGQNATVKVSYGNAGDKQTADLEIRTPDGWVTVSLTPADAAHLAAHLLHIAAK